MLTVRELEVLKQVARGHSDDIVAVNLGISRSTVRTHLRSVFSKLGISNRTAATAWFLTRHIELRTHLDISD